MAQTPPQCCTAAPQAIKTKDAGPSAVERGRTILHRPIGWTRPQRYAWPLVALTPFLAATVLPALAAGTGIVIASPVGLVLLAAASTLGAAWIIVKLEHRYAAMPAQVPDEKALQDIAAYRASNTLKASAQWASVDQAAQGAVPTIPKVPSDQGLEDKQRFMTQQGAPVAAYAKVRPQPIVTQGTQLVSPGSTDGMAYNWIWSRGHNASGQGATWGFCAIDQFMVAFATSQRPVGRMGPVAPSEVFFGPSVGGWPGVWMAMAEVGVTDLSSRYGARFGSGIIGTRSENLALDLTAPGQACKVDLTLERSGGMMANAVPSLARFGLGKMFGRFEYNQNTTVGQTLRLTDTQARPLYAPSKSLWKSLYKGGLRANWHEDVAAQELPLRTWETLDTLQPGEKVTVTSWGRWGGTMVSSLGNIFYAGLKVGGARGFLDAIGVCAANNRLLQGATELEISLTKLTDEELELTDTKRVIEVSLQVHRHDMRRWGSTVPGALGYDYGRRFVDSDWYRIKLAATAENYAAVRRLGRAVESGQRGDTLRPLIKALRDQTALPSTRDHLVGQVFSQDAGVAVNLIPGNVWDRFKPEGFINEMSVRGQSTHLAMTRYELAASKTEASEAQETVKSEGELVAHQHTRSFGPEGKRACRTELTSSRTPQGEPKVKIANIWEMDRANASEVGAFVLQPLHELVGTGMGPMYGAGWRVDRSATLSLELTPTDLRGMREGLSGCGDTERVLVAALDDVLEPCDGAWDTARSQRLVAALDSYVKQARLEAVKILCAAQPGRPTAAPLVLDSTSKMYDLPHSLWREAEMMQASKEEIDRRRDQVAHCRALLASDPLIGDDRRSKYDEAMHKAWVGLGGKAYLPVSAA